MVHYCEAQLATKEQPIVLYYIQPFHKYFSGKLPVRYESLKSHCEIGLNLCTYLYLQIISMNVGTSLHKLVNKY